MALTQYSYIKETDPGRLDQEIRNSAITIALDRVEVLQSGNVDVWFKEALSTEEKVELDNIVAVHVKMPLLDAPPMIEILEQDMEPGKQVGGRFQTKTLLLDISSGVPGTTSVHEFSFPIPISILAAQALIDPIHVGDSMDFVVAPNTIIGTLIEDVGASDNTIRVSQTVLDNSFVGASLKLYDGVNQDNLGCIIKIGYDEGYGPESDLILIETPTVHSFAAASPTYVQFSVRMVDVLVFTSSGRVVIGESKIGSSYVPADTVLQLNYTNGDGLAKKLGIVLEYLY